MEELLLIENYLTKLLTPGINQKLDSRSNLRHKYNLISLASIYTIISLYHEDTNLPLEELLYLGEVSEKQEKVKTPTIDIKYLEDYKKYFNDLIKAFKEDNFIFDDESNIYVSSNDIETIIHPEWLFSLAQVLRSEVFNRVYFYNKNPNFKIQDEESLEKYLHTSKTFLITCPHQSGIETTYNNSKSKTDNQIEASEIVKVDDVISHFKENFKVDNLTITKFIIPSISTIIRRANHLGNRFYQRSIEEQQEYLNKWLLEYLNTNLNSLLDTQILLATDEEEINKLKPNTSLSGLFILYINLLSSLKMPELSLKDFKIKTYISPREISLRKELEELIKELPNPELKQKIDTLKNEITLIDAKKDTKLLARKQRTYFKLLKEFESSEIDLEKVIRRNNLQYQINEERNNSLTDIAFDYDLIFNLLLESSKNGRVYLNPLDQSKLIIELYNQEIGTISFRCEIKLTKLLDFIIETNNKLEEEKYTY